MKSILIPTDFSDNARSAVDYAFKVFGPSFTFTLLHAFQTPTANASSLYSIEPMLKKEAEDSLNSLVNDLRESYDSNFVINHKVLHGSVVDCCEWMIEHHPIDLIIMGTQGAGWLKERVLGSNAAKVIEHVQCAVLCIPEGVGMNHPRNIVWAADNLPVQEDMLAPLRYFSSNSKIPLTVIHVEGEQEKAEITDSYTEGKFGEKLKDIPHKFHQIEANDVVEGIEDYLNTNPVDLLIMVKHNYSLIQGWFHRSPTLKVAMHNRVPLLALHDKKYKA